MQFVSDEPVVNVSDLFFDFDRYGQELAKVVLENRTSSPLTICINGPWGCGKTSLLLAVEHYLNSNVECTTIFFDAWKYSKSESLYVALLKKIFSKLREDNIIERVKARYNDPTVVSYDLWRAAFDMVGQILGLELDPARHIKESSFRENVAFYDEFEKVLKLIVDDVTQKGPFIILVDDLDRCTPNQTVDVLEAIKLFLDIKGCVFIMAMDRSLVQASIRSFYKEISIPGYERQYLDKLIHINFDIPPVNADGVKAFIEKVLRAGDLIWRDVAEECAIAMAGNPRRIKKFVNQFNLVWGIVKDIDYTDKRGVVKKFDKRSLIEWLLLRESSPSLIQDIQLRVNAEEKSAILLELVKLGNNGNVNEILRFIEDNSLTVSVSDTCWNMFKYGMFTFCEDVSAYIQLGQRFSTSLQEVVEEIETISGGENAIVFGERLRAIRESKSLSVLEFANLLNLTETVVSLWEKGARIPRRPIIISMSNKLKLSIEETDALLVLLNYPKLLSVEKN